MQGKGIVAAAHLDVLSTEPRPDGSEGKRGSVVRGTDAQAGAIGRGLELLGRI